MADYDGRYEGNGEDVDNYGGGSSPQPRGGSHGGTDDYSDSKSQVETLEAFYIRLYSLFLLVLLGLPVDKIDSWRS